MKCLWSYIVSVFVFVKTWFMNCIEKNKKAFDAKQEYLKAQLEDATKGTKAEAYVDTGVKILIAVVIGALILGGLYALFDDTVMPTVTEKIEELFDYAG